MTTHDFDDDYWRAHWSARPPGEAQGPPPHPYLEHELSDLLPGTALEAGCGEGAEAVWLAEHGWEVTAVDISEEALRRAAAHAGDTPAARRIRWVESDLGTWDPPQRFDLVTSHYAHAAIPQLELYDRLAGWVAPGGTLLLVGHLHPGGTGTQHQEAHHEAHSGAHSGEHPPEHATVTAEDIVARLDPGAWTVLTADEGTRTMSDPAGRPVTLRDVVVRASRR